MKYKQNIRISSSRWNRFFESAAFLSYLVDFRSTKTSKWWRHDYIEFYRQIFHSINFFCVRSRHRWGKYPEHTHMHTSNLLEPVHRNIENIFRDEWITVMCATPPYKRHGECDSLETHVPTMPATREVNEKWPAKKKTCTDYGDFVLIFFLYFGSPSAGTHMVDWLLAAGIAYNAVGTTSYWRQRWYYY